MKVLIFSDLHGHNFKPYSVTLPTGRNSRLQDAVDVLEEIYVACQHHKVDVVLFAGDLFHARGTLQVAVFNAIYEGIAKIKTRVDSFGILVGNHDQDTKYGDIHACYAFESIVQVMDRPGWFGFGDPSGEHLQVYALPFTEDKAAIEGNLKLAAGSIPSGYPCCCLAHVGVSGAEVGSNFVLKSQHNPTTISFTQAGFNQVFLGHYHKHQVLAPNVRYVGATHQHNWGDTGQNRGYCLWDTEDESVLFIGLHAAPKFVWHEADKVVTKEEVQKLTQGNFVRIKYNVAPEKDAWEWVKKETEEARKVEMWVEPTISSTVTPEDEQKYQPGVDFEDMVESFVADSDIGTLDQDRLVTVGKTILKSVQ